MEQSSDSESSFAEIMDLKRSNRERLIRAIQNASPEELEISAQRIKVSGWRIHLPNSSIKGDGVRVFLSGHHRPYRQDFHAPTKLLPQTIQSPGRPGMSTTRSDDFQRSHPSRH